MESCKSCTWYFREDGICCSKESDCRAMMPEEHDHDSNIYACDQYKAGEFWQ